jgi:hypothetical protein
LARSSIRPYVGALFADFDSGHIIGGVTDMPHHAELLERARELAEESYDGGADAALLARLFRGPCTAVSDNAVKLGDFIDVARDHAPVGIQKTPKNARALFCFVE